MSITTNVIEFSGHQGPKFNYSLQRFEDVLSISPSNILFDHGIRDYHLQVSDDARYGKIFFRNSGGDVPFDLLGAAFWLISRYEEYLPYKADTQNRFHYRSSLAYQFNFLDRPLVNVWLDELSVILKLRFPELQIKKRSYSFVASVDVDNAYKYKFKGFVRTLAGVLSDHNFQKFFERFSIILGRKKDPYDCYDFLIETHKQFNVQAIYFFLLGDYGPNDKNHSAADLRFQKLIKHLSDYSPVGVHPSYGSNGDLRQLKKEVGRLTNIVHRVITKSRQHFSMLRFPNSYQDLLQAGLESDYSMGYTNHNGFRASYCYPYQWYSLDIEAVSTLTIHPFCITDNALLVQSERKHAEITAMSKPIIDTVKKHGGELVSIFHNDNFDEEMKAVYPLFLKEALG